MRSITIKERQTQKWAWKLLDDTESQKVTMRRSREKRGWFPLSRPLFARRYDYQASQGSRNGRLLGKLIRQHRKSLVEHTCNPTRWKTFFSNQNLQLVQSLCCPQLMHRRQKHLISKSFLLVLQQQLLQNLRFYGTLQVLCNPRAICPKCCSPTSLSRGWWHIWLWTTWEVEPLKKRWWIWGWMRQAVN